MTFDHVGIAVADLDAAIAFWTKEFGLRCEHVEEIPAQGVRVAFLSGAIELVQATAPDSGVARFLGERTVALHHVALSTEDLAAALESTDLPEIDGVPRPGAAGHEVAFLHPRATGGVLVEWVQHGQ